MTARPTTDRPVAEQARALRELITELRQLVEAWRLEELRERVDFPEESRKVGRCKDQVHALVERFAERARS